MVSELFLQEARPVAVGIATIVNWLANFTVGLTFPYILVRDSPKISKNFFSVFFPEISLSVWNGCVCGDVWSAVGVPLHVSP